MTFCSPVDADLGDMTPAQLNQLAAAIRSYLIDTVCTTGGHLGPNLGVVELTIALHRVFSSPHDALIWDTGHQSYVHKLLTGRTDLSTLRSAGGVSGYPSRSESEHDWVENSHASTSLSYADGLAKAFELTGQGDRAVVAIVGDGALTGGMCWEAINNIAASDRPVIIVVNDNGRSYAPTVGGLASHLASLRLSKGYEKMLGTVKQALQSTPVVGQPLYGALHGAKKGLKDLVAPQGLFEDLGIKYVGPIDGHSIASLEAALRSARRFGGPVIVHCVTRKGKGFGKAEADEIDRFHAVNRGLAVAEPGWTAAFADELVSLARERDDLVGITAAMLEPVGLGPMKAEFPERVFDVGIAEQHAVTSAAGLAMGGLHPVVALYSTFLNRAFDQMLMDVGLHHLPVTFVLDRAGVTGDDGPSHNGVWDIGILGMVPGMRVAAPRDADRLREELREAVEHDGPAALRYPKGALPVATPALRREGIVDLLAEPEHGPGQLLIVSVGELAPDVLEAAAQLTARGERVTVVDPRWVLPISDDLVHLAATHQRVIVVEDTCRVGSVGSHLVQALGEAQVTVPVVQLAVPQEFLPVDRRAHLLTGLGLTSTHIAELGASRPGSRCQAV